MNINDPTGVYYMLAYYPTWVEILVVYFLTDKVIWLGRKYFQNSAFDYSISSALGDYGLITYIGTGLWILHSSESLFQYIPIFSSRIFQLILFIGSFAIGISMYRDSKEKRSVYTKMDRYHDLIVVPMFIFLLVLSLPLVIILGSGFQRLSLLFIPVWLVTFLIDWVTGRLDQEEFRNRIG